MVTAFLPCRAGSQRIPNKNTKEFSGNKGGLLTIKLKQLLEVPLIDRIILSTNDQKVIDIAFNMDSRVFIDVRPEHLATSETSTDDLINYVPNIISEGHILWTHVTSPFLNSDIYQLAIKQYLDNIKSGRYDSLMTVNKLQTFLWDKNGSVNYDRNVEKWPRTQTLPELFEINSGIFINSANNYLKYNDRIGVNPFLYQTQGLASFDIDWPEDFHLAELMYSNING
ncbi:MAG: acylneuraminate cytidylyltransferase family protein [Sediminicola sp.]